MPSEICEHALQYFCLLCYVSCCPLFLQVKSIQVQKIRYVWNIYAKQFQKVG